MAMKGKEEKNISGGTPSISMNQLAERCVIVYRDENGYGLTVSGDNPVFVQSAKEDGAAARAGVKAGDRILRVNGTCVAESTHMDVVQMISSSPDHIALTLYGRSPLVSPDGRVRRVPNNTNNDSSCSSLSPPVAVEPKLTENEKDGERWAKPSASSDGLVTLPASLLARIKRSSTVVNQEPAKGREFITEPQPIDAEKQAEWKRRRCQILHQMLSDEVQNVQELEVKYRKNASQETESLLMQAQKRLSNMENQFSELQMDLQAGGTDNNSSFISSSKPTGSRSFDDPLFDNGNNVMLSASSVPSFDSAPGSFFRSKHHHQGAQVAPGIGTGATTNLPTSRTFPDGLQYVASAQVQIMDESDSDTEAVVPLETEGPFVNFAELKNRPAHLAVFLHYLLSNCDPSSLFFYLITDAYSHGSFKDMRKWAYEIHSSFITPTAPLRISSIDMLIVQEIDRILCSLTRQENEQDDAALRRAFVKARQVALDEINDLLADFRNKRMLGLGNVYGENKLNGLAVGDSSRERKIVDSLLMQHFENFFCGKLDFDQLSDRQQALAMSLATIAKHMGVKASNPLHEKLVERCPLYVAKEKKTFNLLSSKPSKKPMQIKGHHFTISPVFVSTVCYQCQEMIWGVSPQACFCSNCEVVIHKHCARSLEDTCCGDGYGRAKILPRKHLPLYSKAKLMRDDSTDRGVPFPVPATTLTPPSGPSWTSASNTVPKLRNQETDDDSAEDKDKTTDLPNSPLCKENWASTSVSADSGYGGDSERVTAINAVNVGRSQSMKSHEEQRLSKRSAESGRRTKSDVDTDDKSIALAMSQEPSVSSSSSSMSRTSLTESPSVSTDLANQPTSKPSLDSTTSAGSTVTNSTRFSDLEFTAGDSDLEADNEIPRLEYILDSETLLHLKPKEKKRQEVLNEMFHTERTHVRNLKVLNHVFYEPLLSTGILQPDVIKLLFANIEEILDIHSKLNISMKTMTKENRLIGDVGSLLLPFFDGAPGERFRKAVANFCQHQQHALEILKIRQKKDPKLAQFLQEAESSTICRKLQLKDMLPMEMQRLTKYPLLLETAAKYTLDPSDELSNVKRCVECAKGILDAVNTAKRNSENCRRLEELQRRLDSREFDRVPHVMTKEFKNFDFRKQTLIHDGALTWRLGKNKAVDLHVVLLENLFVLLTRNSDGQRLSLKFHNINFSLGKDDIKFTHCPLLKLNSMMAKNVATDKKAFFVVSTPAQGPQIYELVAQTTSEKKNWFKLITEQIDMCKQRDNAESASSSSSTNQSSGNAATGGVTSQKSEDLSSKVPVPPTSDSYQDERLNASSTSETSQSEEESLLTEKIQITSQPRLINPSEVQICQPTVLEHAASILTPFERLKRNDELIIQSLAEKHDILARTFGFSSENLDSLAGTMTENKGTREAKELALAAVVQTNRILEAINEAMKLSREEEMAQTANPSGSPSHKTTSQGQSSAVVVEKPAVPCATLTRIVAPLMKHLTGLLHGLQSMEDDLRRVRAELITCKAAADAEEASNSSSANVHHSTSAQLLTEQSLLTNVDDYMKNSTLELAGHHCLSYDNLAVSPTTAIMNKARSATPSYNPGGSISTSGHPQASPKSDDSASRPCQQSGEAKSPDSGPDDDEKRREKRKQKRQRHTALSGIGDEPWTPTGTDCQPTISSPIAQDTKRSDSPRKLLDSPSCPESPKPKN